MNRKERCILIERPFTGLVAADKGDATSASLEHREGPDLKLLSVPGVDGRQAGRRTAGNWTDKLLRVNLSQFFTSEDVTQHHGVK